MEGIVIVGLLLACCVGIPAAIAIKSRWGGKNGNRT